MPDEHGIQPPSQNPTAVSSPGANIGAAAGGAASGLFGVVSTLLNNHSQKKMMQKQMDYQNEWAYRQREWAVQDRDYNNWYNSPAQQRQRMIEGGLNPAIMMGNAAGAGVSQPVRSSPSPSVDMRPLDYSGIAKAGGSALASYYDIRMKDAQLKQIEIQNELMMSNVKKNETASQLNVDRSALTQGQAKKLDYWLEGMKQYDTLAQGSESSTTGNYYGDVAFNQVRQGGQDFLNSVSENARREIYAAKNAEQVVARIAQMAIQNARTQAEIDNLKENLLILQKSNVLKQIDIDGQQILNRQFTGTAGQLLLGLLKRADFIR